MNIEIASHKALQGINIVRKAITDDASSDHILSDVDKYEIEQTEKRISFIAKNAGEIIGYLTLYELSILKSCGDAILEMFVLPKFQGDGIGSALLKHSEEHIKRNITFDRLILGVLHSNPRAISFYKRHGFEEEKRDPKGRYMIKKIETPE